MIEVPSAALALRSFIGGCDFISVGTNDLVQYLLAADRTNESLGELYSPHTASCGVAGVLHDVIRTGLRRRLASRCGSTARIRFRALLLALGLTSSACIQQPC